MQLPAECKVQSAKCKVQRVIDLAAPQGTGVAGNAAVEECVA